jgi:hypothetical protein
MRYPWLSAATPVLVVGLRIDGEAIKAALSEGIPVWVLEDLRMGALEQVLDSYPEPSHLYGFIT